MKKIILFIFLFNFTFSLTILALPLYGQGRSGGEEGIVKKPKSKSSGDVVIGNVEKLVGNTVIIKDKKMKATESAVVDFRTKVIKDKRLLKLREIRPDDTIAIVGTDSGGVMREGKKVKRAIKIFVKDATSSAQMKRRAVHGVITNINGEELILAHPRHRDRTYRVLVSEETEIKIKGVTDASLASLQLGQRIAAVGDLAEDGGIVAKRIHVIPGKAKGFQRVSVPLPTPTNTPTPTSIAPTSTITPIITASPTAELTPTTTP